MATLQTDDMPSVSENEDKSEMCENIRLLHDGCLKGCMETVVRALRDVENVDSPEEHGMTALQQAAYRGHLDLCGLLLDRGADVNWHGHEHGYTTLMFAALCGSVSVVSLLLDAGASTTTVNAVGRNAAQMAAFVGNYDCVSVIINYVPLADVEYFAEKHSNTECEPRLPRRLVRPLHRLVTKTNVHPVAVVLFLQDGGQQNNALLDASSRVIDVLDLMCRREAKKRDQTCNEVLCLKLHLLARIIEACTALAKSIVVSKQKQMVSKSMDDVDRSHLELEAATLDDVIRRWLRGHKDDGSPDALERLLRSAILSFPFPHFPLVQQVVLTLTSPNVDRDCVSALALVTTKVRGQRFRSEDEDLQCATCGSLAKSNKKCSACKSLCYCGPHCQRLHWFIHKHQCRSHPSTSSPNSCQLQDGFSN